jgi:DNA-directed RNA polymerase specialized sigma24 family protein
VGTDALSPALDSPRRDVPFDALYQAVSPVLTRILRRIRLDEADRQDVAQEVRLSIFQQAIRGLPPEHPILRWVRGEHDAQRHLQRWVGCVAYHVILNYQMRSYRRREKLSPRGIIHTVGMGPSPAEQAAIARRARELWKLLGK